MTPPLPSSSVGPGLHLRRCVRHSSRDAAARCPSCQQYFCRECVVEHDGRLLCSDCLRREGHQAERRRQAWAVVRRGLAASFGFIVLWLAVAGVGLLLVKVPPEVHAGTVWRKLLGS